MANSSNVTLPLDTAIPKLVDSNIANGKASYCKDSDVKIKKESSISNSPSSNNGAENTTTGSSRCQSHPTRTNHNTFDDKRVNGVKRDPKGSSLHVPESYTVTSDSQIWLECCHYSNSFRACGGNVRSFQPNSPKVNGNHLGSPNHLYPQGAAHCSQGHHNASTSVNYNRNTQQYVVHLHVNPGEMISFDMGDHVQHIQGPATVRMVSHNSTPPVPMPVQVPPGHMVQQIVDENGTLRHIILSPQPPLAVPAAPPYNGTSAGGGGSIGGGSSPFYLYPHPSCSLPTQFPPHMQHSPLEHHTNGHGMADSSSHLNTFKDERTQRQFYKLRKRLETRHRDVPSHTSSNHETSPRLASENVHSDTISNKSTSEKDAHVMEALSSIKIPTVAEITPTSALIEWASPDVKSEDENAPAPSDISYNLLLCDNSKDSSAKSIYSGKETKFHLSDLKPATSYSVKYQAKCNSLSGKFSESVTFKTLSCKPDVPQSPKFVSRTKTTISMKWNAAVDNGAKITAYVLQYDEGTGSENFVELFNGLQKQYKAIKLKESTCYRFRLAAVNEQGQSGFSTVSEFITSGSCPSQPAPPALKEAQVSKLELHWEQRPNDDNYTLQMDDSRTLHGFLPVYNGKETSYTCLHLTHNASYKFRLSASNEEGSSPWSQVVSFSTLPDKPDRPGKPSLKGKIHSTFFKVAWDPPKEDGGCPITEYFLELDNGTGFEVVYTGEELEFLCENLQPGKTYSVRVQCSSLGGRSEFSEVGTVATCPVVPGKCLPPKLHGKAKALSIHLKWAHPEYDGGSEVQESEIEVSHPDDTSRLAYKGSATDCAVAGLLPGRNYRFRVRAYNKVGAGHWSDALEATSGAGTPDAPTDVQASARSPHVVFVSWAEPPCNGAAITEYRLEGKCSEKEYELVYSGLQNSAEVKSLVPATVYYFQVQALNSAGAGGWSTPAACCQMPASSPGAVATAGVRISATARSVSLAWREPACHGAPVTTYNVEVGDVVHTIDVPEITVEGLAPETTYKVRVQAVNSVGPGPFSAVLKAVTRGLPPAPPLLECCGATHSALRLRWAGDGRTGTRSYTLEMESPQAKRFVPLYQGPGHSFKASKLQELTAYNFRIFASNEEGDGPCSEVFSFTTQRALPMPFKAPKVSNATESSCLIEWPAAKAIGDDMLSYKLQLGTKESDFHVIYTGIQTSHPLRDLSPGMEYSVRVAAVRHSADGELPGPFSPSTVFCTEALPVAQPPTPSAFSLASRLRNREPLSDQQWAIIILCAFTLIAICVAIVIQQALSS